MSIKKGVRTGLDETVPLGLFKSCSRFKYRGSLFIISPFAVFEMWGGGGKGGRKRGREVQ